MLQSTTQPSKQHIPTPHITEAFIYFTTIWTSFHHTMHIKQQTYKVNNNQQSFT
jgi:hypothetical protein